jgi:ABC-type sugar transport system ATPase subunit
MTTTPPAPAIRVRGLEKSYPKVRVLRGVDFDVARGSIATMSPADQPRAVAREASPGG